MGLHVVLSELSGLCRAHTYPRASQMHPTKLRLLFVPFGTLSFEVSVFVHSHVLLQLGLRVCVCTSAFPSSYMFASNPNWTETFYRACQI